MAQNEIGLTKLTKQLLEKREIRPAGRDFGEYVPVNTPISIVECVTGDIKLEMY